MAVAMNLTVTGIGSSRWSSDASFGALAKEQTTSP
jgi:hypothetical protein